jgi:hypothetical protein
MTKALTVATTPTTNNASPMNVGSTTAKLRGLAVDRDRDQVVFRIEGLGVCQAAFHARCHIAVGVIAVALATAEGGHSMFVGRIAIGIGGIEESDFSTFATCHCEMQLCEAITRRAREKGWIRVW